MESGSNNGSNAAADQNARGARGGGKGGAKGAGNEPQLPMGNEDEDWGVPTGPDVVAVPMGAGDTYESMREEWKGA